MENTGLIRENYNLRAHNTFGVDAWCSRFCSPHADSDMLALSDAGVFGGTYYVLGCGSNVVFLHDYEGSVVHLTNDYIRIVGEEAGGVLVEAGAGTMLDAFIEHCVEQGWQGVENLSGIPSSVGAVPVQNVGAYGVEAAQAVECVRVFDVRTMQFHTMTNSECEFAYRSSVFKRGLANKKIVVSVVFRLKVDGELHTEYSSLHNELLRVGAAPTLRSVRSAVLSVRSSKLPDPLVLGNAGSFFKNPVLPKDYVRELVRQFPDIVMHEEGDGVKVSAAWLVERCGWGGVRSGNVGTYGKQPLVIVNYGGASGSEVAAFAQRVADAVRERTGIALEREVEYVA